MGYLRLSGPVTVPVVVVVVDRAVVVVVDVVVVVEPVFIVGMTAADSFSLSLSALSSDQYLFTHVLYRCALGLRVSTSTVITNSYLSSDTRQNWASIKITK